ncbi:MAG: TIR domain-containing protein [Alphaproteobacteria bacterium]|nr:TIR domain-containing protein [Alphaproteobacteria bacterium]
MAAVEKPRVFVSFDYDNDEDVKNLFVGQSRLEGSPFGMEDWSVKQTLSGDWKSKVHAKIKMTDKVIVLCGAKTDSAAGVSEELRIARRAGIPYFLVRVRGDKSRKPKAAQSLDKMHDWDWPTLKRLIGVRR